MKTSRKSDELKKKVKKGGPQIGYLWFENVEVFVDIIIVNIFSQTSN